MQQSPLIMEKLREQVSGRLVPGDGLVVIGPVGLEGTRELVKENREQLRARFSERFLRRCLLPEVKKSTPKLKTGSPEPKVESSELKAESSELKAESPELKAESPEPKAVSYDLEKEIVGVIREYQEENTDSLIRLPSYITVNAWIAVQQEGFLSALWKLAEVSGVGLQLDLRKIPIFQETVEICEACGEDPYRIACGACAIAGLPQADMLAEHLRQAGWMTAVIGSVQPGRQRLLFSAGQARFLERPDKL